MNLASNASVPVDPAICLAAVGTYIMEVLMQRGKECIPAATDTPQMRSCFGSVRVEAGYIVTGKIPEHHKCKVFLSGLVRLQAKALD
jgi:hypothetical protein